MKSVSSFEMWQNGRQFFEPGLPHLTSQDEAGQWICFDFQEMLIVFTQYRLLQHPPYMVSWVVEMSMDGNNWTEVHRVDDFTPFPMMHMIIWPVLDDPKGRFVRLTQTAPNAEGSHVLSLLAIQMYGTLLEFRE
jgi:hypothetical protein